MIAAPTLRKSRRARAAKAQTLSTSQARANFAEALGLAQKQNTIIGFDRYGKLVAAVVPIDAVRMLARRDDEVEPAVRNKIERMSRIFLHAAPAPRAMKASSGAEHKAKGKRSKDKRRRKKSKPARTKQHRRVFRKI
ncbi:MAG: hypothetical protein JSS00_03810 [Proteobacteria bacterium]|nr:hypothetical protein [Pseudomonadota bacterium]